MSISRRSKLLYLTPFICFILLIFTFSWPFLNPFRPQTRAPKPYIGSRDPLFQTPIKFISHQAASDPFQHILPYNATLFDHYGESIFPLRWNTNPSPLTSPLPTHRSAISKHGARVACWPR
ncbi:hypothetical protein IQ06DRAFT_374966 [Phaeosphaeriaceae sp. SRC1lsM3a]|nr:hypothetical protein IQ06DRAFT_374966 [Stagonospora sp. SRC1lsM3a]